MKKFTIALDVDDTVMPYHPLLCKLMGEKYGIRMTQEDITEWKFTNFPEEIREKLYGIMGLWRDFVPVVSVAECFPDDQ